MALIPMLYSDWWEDLDRPHSLIDQHFGLPVDPEDISQHHRGGIINRHLENLGYPFFRRMRRRYHPFHHALSSSKHAKRVTPLCNTDRDKFVITLDVQQFAIDEITVKTIEKHLIVVEARHEEREDEHGWISRRFTRKYHLPSNYDIEQIESSLSSDGVLTITAPKKKMTGDNSERVVKIQYTGEPAIFEQQRTKSVQGQSEEYSREHSQQRAGPMSQQRGKKLTVKGVPSL